MISWIFKIQRMSITDCQLKLMISLHFIRMFNKSQFLWSLNKECKQGNKLIHFRLIKWIRKICNFKRKVIQIYRDQLKIQSNKIEMAKKTFRARWFIKVCLSSYRMARWHKLFKEINKILYLVKITLVQFKLLCHLKMI